MKKFFFCLFYSSSIALGNSFVYNLRIAQTTREQAVHNHYGSIFALTPIEQFRETYGGIKQETDAGMFSYIYRHDKIFGHTLEHSQFYVHIDAAVGRIKESIDESCLKRHQMDDILTTVGYSHAFSGHSKVSISALLGIPTHGDSVQFLEFGTGHASLGLQLDGLYTYKQHHGNHAMIGAARYIRFFERTVHIDIPPIVGTFKFNIGNLADILIAHQSVWGRHRLEFGYNATWAFNPSLCPEIPEILTEAQFMRNSFYLAYSCGFLICHHPSALILGFSYGFDKKHLFTIKNSYTTWLTWGINF